MSKLLLVDRSLVVIFAYEPMGFGHLRVTDALYHGLPEGVAPILLGSQDRSLGTFYRFVSIHPITRAIMELMLRNPWEKAFAFFYKWYLVTHTKLLYEQFATILDQRIEVPKTVLIVATHYGLGHQLGAIKARLEREKGIRIYLLVLVTDDSPQRLWYVDKADLLFVPSHFTREKLLEYAKSAHLPITNVVVNPYPVSPFFSEVLSEHDFHNRENQLDPREQTKMHVMIPVSGAAVGMHFFAGVIKRFGELHPHVQFDVIAKAAPYTKKFLETMTMDLKVEVHVSTHDREVVNLYENAYNTRVFSLEITKPSEQAFKALLSPRQKAGTIMLFSQPVGKQEYDNIFFLHRHHLLPSEAMQSILWEKARKNQDAPDEALAAARGWRTLRLPEDPLQAGEFIQWCYTQKIFFSMVSSGRVASNSDEIGSDGVYRFWDMAESFLEKQAQNNK